MTDKPVYQCPCCEYCTHFPKALEAHQRFRKHFAVVKVAEKPKEDPKKEVTENVQKTVKTVQKSVENVKNEKKTVKKDGKGAKK